MKIQPYVSKLHSSAQYKDFQDKYKDAFLAAGFFVIDFETGNNLHQIDYYVPSSKKFAAFTLDKGVKVQLLKSMDKKAPGKLDMKTNIDLDALQGIILDEMKNRNITHTIKNMIAFIQNHDGKNVWNVNCVLSGMDLLRVHVEDSSQTILKMEKSSLMDYVKRMPAPQEAIEKPEAAKEDVDKKIEQLDKLKDLLRKQKAEIENKQAEKESSEPSDSKK